MERVFDTAGRGNIRNYKGQGEIYMADKLTKKDERTIAVINKTELGDIIKPLIREIHLFDTYIAGTTYLKDKEVLEKIKIGNSLSLQREDNTFDSNAILVLNADKKKLGYIPEKDNIIFARLMDAGKLLKAKVAKIELKGSFRKITIGIYLVDL